MLRKAVVLGVGAAGLVGGVRRLTHTSGSSSSSVPNTHSSLYHHATYNHHQSKGRVIIIGDVHGCPAELLELLAKVNLSSDDQLVFAGDLVRKGPDSNKVVDIARKHNALGVRGNHDEYALQDGTNRLGLSSENVKYLQSLPLSLHLPDFNVLVVHAGMPPGVVDPSLVLPMDLMTMRWVSKHTLQPCGKTKEDAVLWAEQWRGPFHVVFGHDAARGLQQHPLATGLDTGCVYGRKLTALILPQFELVSVHSHQPDPFAATSKI